MKAPFRPTLLLSALLVCGALTAKAQQTMKPLLYHVANSITSNFENNPQVTMEIVLDERPDRPRLDFTLKSLFAQLQRQNPNRAITISVRRKDGDKAVYASVAPSGLISYFDGIDPALIFTEAERKELAWRVSLLERAFSAQMLQGNAQEYIANKMALDRATVGKLFIEAERKRWPLASADAFQQYADEATDPEHPKAIRAAAINNQLKQKFFREDLRKGLYAILIQWRKTLTVEQMAAKIAVQPQAVQQILDMGEFKHW